MLRRLLFPAALALLTLSHTGQAKPPVLSSVTPAAVKPGQATDIKLQGKYLAGATLWLSFPAEVSLTPDIPDNGTNPAEATYRLNVPATVPPGIHGIRAFTSEGVTSLALLLVDDVTTVPQTPGIFTLAQAQELTLPAGVDGNMDAARSHYFKLNVTAGQKVSIEVLAKRLNSTFDPLLRVLDATGRGIAYGDDAVGLGGDVQFTHTFAQPGTYYLELRDIQYRGGGGYRYRLRVGDFPCVITPYPLAAQRGQTVNLNFAGSDLENVVPGPVATPGQPELHWQAVAARREGGLSSGLANLLLSDRPETLEVEPNDEPAQATPVELTANFNGQFNAPGDLDLFKFAAKKDQELIFQADTRQLGAPADLVLALLNEQGGQLAQADDAGTEDAQLKFKFPADGVYLLKATELQGRGGEQFAYRVSVVDASPGFELTLDQHSLNVPAGGTVTATLTVTRKGHVGPILIETRGLPESLTQAPTTIGPAMNSVTLSWTQQGGNWDEQFKGKIFPVQIVGKASIGPVEQVIPAAISGQRNNPLAHSIIIGNAPPTGYTLRVEPAAVTVPQGGKATIKVIAVRQAEFDEIINLARKPAQNGLPPNVALAVKPIAKGQNEIELELAPAANAPVGTFTAVIEGNHKKGDVTELVPTPGFTFTIEAKK